jgi:hypothetical protein
VPAYDLDEVKRLAQTGQVQMRPRKSRDIVGDLLDLEPREAEAFVVGLIGQLRPEHFAETKVEKTPPADVFGIFFEGRGWYIKVAIDRGRLAVISCHPPEIPLRTRAGTITPRI